MITGGIIIWSGAIVDIPDGYALCDGNNGTPDLRNLFVVGAGDTYNPDDNVAAPTHTHPFTGTDHNHSIPNTNACPGGGGTLCLNGTDSGNTAATGTTDAQSVLPPYYSLAYIMKL